MKRDSYRDCSGTGWFRYRSAGPLRKITLGTLVLNWAGPSTMTLVSSTTMARPMKPTGRWCFWVVTGLTRMLALKWVTTG